MLHVNNPVSDLANLSGIPSPSASVQDLYAAAGAYTGLGVASPQTAEIVGAVMSAVTAMLTQRSSLGDGGMPRWHDDPAPLAMSQAWPELASEKRGRTRLSLAPVPASPVDGQTCAVVAVDIVGFTRADRDDDIRRYLHERLYAYLQQAFDRSGVPWAECFCEDRGDGALIVIPPELPIRGLIDPLPEKLRALIRRHNHVSAPAADMQLRVAAHVGPVEHDGHGFVGTDVNFAFRMLDAKPLKNQLAESGAELGLIVSDYVYSSLICRHPALAEPGAYRIVRFRTKDTAGRAWTYLPG